MSWRSSISSARRRPENDRRAHRHDHQAPEEGERVKIVGLGILQVRNRAARMGRNPATGEPIQIKASKKVAFRASKELKEAVDRHPSCHARDGAIIFSDLIGKLDLLRVTCR